ncbi:sugar transferase [Gammaproteobacteria bacterium]|nr:sugar transferase [Gammaproteobacteria bacterium]
MQRLFDIIFSTLALLFLSPLLIPIMLLLRFSGEGEVFFTQKRVGKGGEFFDLLKFATMLKDSPNIGTGTITMKDDPRILPFGGLLRKTKINELPQLINIFLGDMSVIGPRPLTKHTFSSYSSATQDAIKFVKPGLSGVQQVVIRDEEGLLDGTSASVSFYDSVLAPYKGELEEWYVSNKSLSIYFLTILMTVWIILAPKSSLVWRVFKDLPEPPTILKQALNYTD